jgi:hypothetical protein
VRHKGVPAIQLKEAFYSSQRPFLAGEEAPRVGLRLRRLWTGKGDYDTFAHMSPTRYLLLVPLIGFAATDAWQRFAVDERLTVQLPGPTTALPVARLLPAGQAPAHTQTWVARASQGLCVVMRVPTANGQVIKQGDLTKRRLFYDQVVKGALMEENQAHLLTRTSFQTGGGSGVEIKYTALDARTGHRRVRYMRSLVLDSIGYNLIFRPANLADSSGLSDQAQGRRFFGSLTIKP